MLIKREGTKLSSKWYSKDTDTGLILNCHALSPVKYKKSVVSGLIHRIFCACSTWENFHESVTKAKTILCNNQYPTIFLNRSLKKC